MKRNVKITPTPIQIKLAKKSPYTHDRWLVETSHSIITNQFNQLVNEQTLMSVRSKVQKNLESLSPEATTEARSIRAFLNQITDLEEKWKSLTSDLDSIYNSILLDSEYKKLQKELIYSGRFTEAMSNLAVYFSPRSHQDQVLQDFAKSIHQNFDLTKYYSKRLEFDDLIGEKLIGLVNKFQKKCTECLKNIHRSYARALGIDEDEYVEFCELIAQRKFTNAHTSLKKIADKISWDPILNVQAKFLSVIALEGNATEPKSYQIYKLGLELIQLTELVPEGKQFLDCQNTILYYAAQLCLLAGEQENNDIEIFGLRHSSYAITSFALISKMIQEDFFDPSGRIWEMRALAYYYTGNPYLAWDCINLTEAPRNLSIDFYLNRFKIAWACISANQLGAISKNKSLMLEIKEQINNDVNKFSNLSNDKELLLKSHPYIAKVLKNLNLIDK